MYTTDTDILTSLVSYGVRLLYRDKDPYSTSQMETHLGGKASPDAMQISKGTVSRNHKWNAYTDMGAKQIKNPWKPITGSVFN